MKTFLLVLGLAASFLPFHAAAQTSTVPVGYLTCTFTSDTRYFSAPLTADVAYAGKAASVGTDSINVTDASWTADQFVYTPCHVLATSGAEAGRTLRIVANTATQLTVDITDGSIQTTGLDTADFAFNTGDGFEIFTDHTLGTVFGATALVGGTDADTADSVGVWNAPASAFEFYYIDTSVGHWVKHGDPMRADYTAFAIAPGAAMAVVRPPGRIAARVVLTGHPPAVAPLLKLIGGDVTQYCGTPFPVDITLSQLNLATHWKKKNSALKADTLILEKPARAKWLSYHEHKNGVWLKGSGAASKNATPISAGGVFGFRKHRPASGAASFVQVALPYTP